MEINTHKKVWKKKNPRGSWLINQDLKKISEGNVYYKGQTYQFSNVIQYFIAKKYCSPEEEANKNLFLNCLVNARKYCPGTELILCELILSKSKDTMESISRVSSFQALQITSPWLEKERSKNIVEQIVSIMGSTGRIHIVEEPIQSDELILNTKCVTDISIDPKFTTLVDVHRLKFDFANVCVIEGAPASVSEINNLLLWSAKEKSPLIIVARSFPEEITNTLAVNWKNGKLRIIPYVYGNTIYNLNAHADVASISNAKVVSALKGDTLHRDLDKKVGNLTNVLVKNNSLSATPSTYPEGVISNLKKRLLKLDWSDKDRRDIYLSRLAGLSDKTLTVRLRDSIETWKIKNEIEIGINMYNAACANVVRVCFSNGDKKFYPLNIYKKAKELQNVYDKTMESIGGYLVTP